MRPARKAATATSLAALSTAGARAARGERGIGQRRQGNASQVGRFEIQPPMRQQVEAGDARLDPSRPGESDRERRAHVGQAQLRQRRAVDEFDQRMHQALRMHEHVDAIARQRRTGGAPR